MTANRLLRWAIILSAFQCNISYVSSKLQGAADGPSRLPVGTDSHFEQNNCK